MRCISPPNSPYSSSSSLYFSPCAVRVCCMCVLYVCTVRTSRGFKRTNVHREEHTRNYWHLQAVDRRYEVRVKIETRGNIMYNNTEKDDLSIVSKEWKLLMHLTVFKLARASLSSFFWLLFTHAYFIGTAFTTILYILLPTCPNAYACTSITSQKRMWGVRSWWKKYWDEDH